MHRLESVLLSATKNFEPMADVNFNLTLNVIQPAVPGYSI